MYKVFCNFCKVHLYNFQGVFEGKFRRQDFVPAHAGVPTPAEGVPMLCRSCDRPFYLLTDRGSVIVLTDKGYKPRAPQGDRAPSEIDFLHTETPEDLQGTRSEFRDSSERR